MRSSTTDRGLNWCQSGCGKWRQGQNKFKFLRKYRRLAPFCSAGVKIRRQYVTNSKAAFPPVYANFR